MSSHRFLRLRLCLEIIIRYCEVYINGPWLAMSTPALLFAPRGEDWEQLTSGLFNHWVWTGPATCKKY